MSIKTWITMAKEEERPGFEDIYLRIKCILDELKGLIDIFIEFKDRYGSTQDETFNNYLLIMESSALKLKSLISD